MNYLKSVFWEYTDFQNDDYLLQILKESRLKKDRGFLQWMMVRFLEYGRVVDTLKFFPLDEIADYFPHLRLTQYTKNKWSRLIEVYRAS